MGRLLVGLPFPVHFREIGGGQSFGIRKIERLGVLDHEAPDVHHPTLVKKGATIGANVTIVCGTTIGRYAFIGAGAVITKGIPDHALMVGNPATRIGWACECGERLPNNLECLSCGKKYQELDSGLIAK